MALLQGGTLLVNGSIAGTGFSNLANTATNGALLAASGRIELGGKWALSAESHALVASGNSELAGSISLGWRF